MKSLEAACGKMKSDSEGRLKLWIRGFATSAGRKPQANDMPEEISESYHGLLSIRLPWSLNDYAFSCTPRIWGYTEFSDCFHCPADMLCLSPVYSVYKSCFVLSLISTGY